MDLTKEEGILTLKVVFMVIVLDVVKKGIDLLNVDHLKVGNVWPISYLFSYRIGHPSLPKYYVDLH